jgi:hypothetical protein
MASSGPSPEGERNSATAEGGCSTSTAEGGCATDVTRDPHFVLHGVPEAEYRRNLSQTLGSLSLEDDARILILRCAQAALATDLIEQVLEAWPKASIDLLAQEEFLPFVAHNPRIRFLPIHNGPIARNSFPSETLAATRAAPPRIGLIPFSNSHGGGYRNVHAVLRCLSRCPFVGIGCDGKKIPIRLGLASRFVRAALRSAGLTIMLPVLGGMWLFYRNAKFSRSD